MNEFNFAIRRATIDDIGKLTELHCSSFKPNDHVPMLLGKDYVRATYKWQVLAKSAYVLVAEFENEIVGLVAVCDGSFAKAMFFACMPDFIIALVKRPILIINKLLWKRLLRQPRIKDKVKKVVDSNKFAQMSIGAVRKEYRGSGVFGQLINAAKEYSEKRGSVAIRAGIYKNNHSSRRVFIKSGWHEVPQLETEDTVFYVSFMDKNIAIEFDIEID